MTNLMREPLTVVPTLDALAADPTQAVKLAPSVARALWARCVIVQNALLPALTTDVGAHDPSEEEAAVGIDEAAQTLSIKVSTLYRKWRVLGGYRDVDGRVKFTRAALRRYLGRKGG